MSIDRTTLLLILRSHGSEYHHDCVTWLVSWAPYWALQRVCILLGDGLPVVRVHVNGSRWWYSFGVIHRGGDRPAAIRANGTQMWYKYGQQHRDGDLPAVIEKDGTQQWYKHDELHRDGDLPAIIHADGTREWWQNGEKHRDGDAPALIYADGTQMWYKHGEIHRDGKPAVINPDRSWLCVEHDKLLSWGSEGDNTLY